MDTPTTMSWMDVLTASSWAAYVWKWMLVFARVMMLMMQLPAFGDTTLPGRIRTMVAAALAVSIAPQVWGGLPDMPSHTLLVGLMVVREGLLGWGAGLLIGHGVTYAVEMASTLAGTQMGLSNAMVLNPSFHQQTLILGFFFQGMVTVLIFATDLHLVFIRALVASYTLWPVTLTWNPTDLVEALLSTFAASFAIAVQIAGPFIGLGVLFFAGLGLMNRVFPQLNLFFIIMPGQIGLGLLLLWLCFVTQINAFMGYYGRHLTDLLQGG